MFSGDQFFLLSLSSFPRRAGFDLSFLIFCPDTRLEFFAGKGAGLLTIMSSAAEKMRAEARMAGLHNPIGFHICGGGTMVFGIVPAEQPMLVPELLCAGPAALGAVFCDAGGVDADGETGFVEFGLLDGVAFVF